MDRRDDISFLYKKSDDVKKGCLVLFWIVFAISVISIWLPVNYLNAITLLQIIISFSFMVLEIIHSCFLWYDAEAARRRNGVQNAFEVKLAEYETQGYYNNRFSPSQIKYAVNIFESNFFTRELIRKMLPKTLLKGFCAIVIFIISVFLSPNRELIVVISQTVFSTYILADVINTCVCSSKMNKLYEEAYTQFVSVGISDNLEAWILAYVVEYESVKAHYKVKIDGFLFQRYNRMLSRRWEDIEKDIKIL